MNSPSTVNRVNQLWLAKDTVITIMLRNLRDVGGPSNLGMRAWNSLAFRLYRADWN